MISGPHTGTSGKGLQVYLDLYCRYHVNTFGEGFKTGFKGPHIFDGPDGIDPALDWLSDPE